MPFASPGKNRGKSKGKQEVSKLLGIKGNQREKGANGRDRAFEQHLNKMNKIKYTRGLKLRKLATTDFAPLPDILGAPVFSFEWQLRFPFSHRKDER